MTMLQRYTRGRTNAELVADILRVFFPDASTCVDLTPGRGGFWSERVPIHVSVALSPHDFRSLPYAHDNFDVGLIDPPHLADAGKKSIMGQRYGTYKQADLEPLVRAGTREAWRVSRLGIVVKVTDHVHGQRFVSESDWVRGALGGQTPFDIVHYVRPQSLGDGKWREPQLSARNNGSTFLIFRKGDQRHLRGKEGPQLIEPTPPVRSAARSNQAADPRPNQRSKGKAER